jgi:hypothetical protein
MDCAKINSCFTALKLSPNFCYRWRGVSQAHTPPVGLERASNEAGSQKGQPERVKLFLPGP